MLASRIILGSLLLAGAAVLTQSAPAVELTEATRADDRSVSTTGTTSISLATFRGPLFGIPSDGERYSTQIRYADAKEPHSSPNTSG